jgi:TolB-like protein/Tfp pilus assembly protein PilF
VSFFAELKRRNVFRVGIAYLVVAWLVMQVTDVVINNIDAPDWVFQVIMLVLGIGFPVVLLFAWAFELTPEGIKREKDIDRSQSIVQTTGRKLDRAIIFILVIALAYFVYDKFAAPPPAETVTAMQEESVDKSIAVLPFVNMSADEENEYFSDGLSEELLNLLAKVDGLKVAARTSSFKFRNAESDISEIGGQLNVATVLEGSVRKAGDQVRITAQLIKVDDGFHMWSETYDRKLDNIFEVQDEIARAIVDALKLPLLGHDAKPLSTRSTDNFAAYDLYLLGTHHARKYSKKDFEKARDYFLKAIEIDPGYAPAYGSLVGIYVLLSDFGDLPRADAFRLATEAAEKARALDPDNVEAHTSIGLLMHSLGRQSMAVSYFEKALKVNPNHVNTLLWYRQSLSGLGRINEASTVAERALELDPLSPAVRRHYIHQLTERRQIDQAVEQIQAMVTANPSDADAYELWGDLYMETGQPHRAIPMYRNAHRLRPGDIYMASRNVTAALQLNDPALTDFWLQQARERGEAGQWTRAAEGAVMFARGEIEPLMAQYETRLQRLPEYRTLLTYKGTLLSMKGEHDAALKILGDALTASGYQAEAPLAGDQVGTVMLLADIHDKAGREEERDSWLELVDAYIEKAKLAGPPTMVTPLAAAQAASVRSDLAGVINGLTEAIKNGYRDHWDLVRNPVFDRWQDNPEFIAVYQDMLKAAEQMRNEYKANNPVEFDLPVNDASEPAGSQG